MFPMHRRTKLSILCILATASLGCQRSHSNEPAAPPPSSSKPQANVPMAVTSPLAADSSTPSQTPVKSTAALPSGSRIRTPDGHDIIVAPGEPAEIELRTKHQNSGASRDVHRTAESKGVGLQTESDQAALKFKPEAAHADLPPDAPGAELGSGGGGSSGGGAFFDGSLFADKKVSIFYIIGAALLLGAGVYWWINKINPLAWKTAMLIAAAGIANIGVGVLVNDYPWVVAVAAVAAVCLGIAWFWQSRQHTEVEAGATKFVKAVDTLPPVTVTQDMVGKPLNLKKIVKDHIEETAGATDKLVRKVVTRIKNKVETAQEKAAKITDAPHA